MEEQEQEQAWDELFRAADEYGFNRVDVTVKQASSGGTCEMAAVPISWLRSVNHKDLFLVSWKSTSPQRVTQRQIEDEAKRCGFTHVDLHLLDKRTNQLVRLWGYSVGELEYLGDYWSIEKWDISTYRDDVAPKQGKHLHYFKDVRHLDEIDVYRVLELYEVTDPCIAHAVKKLLVPGNRGGGKDRDRDIQEAIDSLERYKEMRREENEINRN